MEIQERILHNYLQDIKLVDIVYKKFKGTYDTLSQKEQILLLFIFESNLISEEILKYYPNYQVKTLLSRLEKDNYITPIGKQGKFKIYNLSDFGRKFAERLVLKSFEDDYDYKQYLLNLRSKKNDNNNLKEEIRLLHRTFSELEIRPDVKDELIIDIKAAAEIDYECSDLLLSDFQNSISLIQELYRDDVEDIKKLKIKFVNIPESEYQHIHNIDREYKGLIYTKGLVTSKKENIISKILNYQYLCTNPSCDLSNNKVTAQLKIKTCPKCKSSIELVNEERINQLESKITNIESGISFPLYLHSKTASNFAFIGLGDEVEIIGHLEDKLVEGKEKDTKEIIKVIVVNSFKKIDLARKLTIEEIDEVEKKIESLDEEFYDYLKTPFINYEERDFIKELFIIQQLTRHKPENGEFCMHFAWMGEPGVGKNELLKICLEYFPNNDSVTGADITDAGFKGTVNRDTGIKEIGLAKQTAGGTIWLNEFDKFIKTNSNGKKAGSQLLNGTMTEQEVKLNKAGIKITYKNLDLRHNLVFNPLDESKIKEDIPYNKMSEILDKSLLSRTIPLYVGRDKDRSRKVFKIMLSRKTDKFNINPVLYQNILLYLRNKDIEISKKAEEKLEEIYNELLDADNHSAVSIERLGLILLQLTKAVTKYKLKTKAGINEVKEAYNYYLKSLSTVGINLDNLEMLFLDESVENLKTIVEIKLYIERKIKTVKILLVQDLEKLFDKKILLEAIERAKKENIIYEPVKGELRRL